MALKFSSRQVAGVALAILVLAIMIWAGLVLVSAEDKSAAQVGTTPINNRIQVLYHLDDSGKVKGYELVKDDRILLMLWDDDGDGLLNMLEYYVDGESEVLVQDRNGDRKADWWQLRTGVEEAALARDDDYDGVVDKESTIRFVTKH